MFTYLQKNSRRFIPLFLVVLVVSISAFGIASAQNYKTVTDLAKEIQNEQNLTPAQQQAQKQANINAQNAVIQAGVNKGVYTPECGGIFSDLSPSCVFLRIFSYVVYWWLWLVKWLLWAAAKLFEYAIELSIINFSNLAGSSGTATSFVHAGWVTFRDMCNIFFIFILLWTAIKTILGLGQNTTKAVINIILAALLINFSATFTRVVIDSGNVLALTFYNAAKGTEKWGISGRVMTALDITKLSQQVSPQSGAGSTPAWTGEAPVQEDSSKFESLDFMQILIQGVGGSLYILAATILFLVFAFLLLQRTLILLFLIITSPYPFLSWAFSGGLGGLGKKWWDQLVCQTYWLFLSMLLFHVSLGVINGGKDAIMTTSAGAAGSIAFFIIGIGFLYASLIVPRELSCSGAGKAVDFGKKKFQQYSSGAGAWLGRNTVGRAGSRLASGSTGAASESGIRGVAGRLGMRAGNAVAGVSFGVKGGSLTDTREASAKAKEAQHKELGKVDEGAVARESAREAQRFAADPAAYRRSRVTEAIMEENRNRARRGGALMTPAEQAIFVRNEARRYATPETAQQTIQNNVAQQHRERGQERQASFVSSLERGGPLGMATRRQPGTILATDSSFTALGRIGRNTHVERNRADQVRRIEARRDDLRNQANALPVGDPTRRDLEREIYQLEGQLLSAGDAATAARARASATAAPTPPPAPTP
ncbi:MAG TPA: hypothetical protein VJJ22_04845 [Candidatus Paceibacterota bacterium]